MCKKYILYQAKYYLYTLEAVELESSAIHGDVELSLDRVHFQTESTYLLFCRLGSAYQKSSANAYFHFLTTPAFPLTNLCLR